MIALLLALQAVAPPPASAPADPAAPESLTGSIKGLFKGDDYPAAALDRNEQGDVAIAIQVDEAGHVADCQIERSSGSPSIDAQTCRIIWLRAKFAPGHDKQGRPVGGVVHQTVKWRIEFSQSPSENWTRRTISAVRAGRPFCTTEGTHAAEKVPTSEVPCEVGAEELIKEFAKHPKAEWVIEQQFTFAAPPPPATAVGDTLRGRQVVQLEVDAAGKLQSCRVVEVEGKLPAAFPGLCPIAPKDFKPRTIAPSKPVPFTAFMAITGYIRGY